MNKRNPLFLGLTLAFVVACGDGGNKDKAAEAEEGKAGSSVVLSDESVAGESVAASVDDALADAAESPDSSPTTTLALEEAAGSGRPVVERFRSCAEEGDKAVVSFKRSISRSRSFDKGGRTGSMEFSDLFEGKRTWALDGEKVECHSNGKQADISGDSVEGLSLGVSFKRERLQKSSFKLRNGKEMARESTIKGEGSRTISFTDVSTADNINKVTTSVKSSVKRDINMKKMNGEALSLSSEVKTDDAAPMVIVTERKADDNALVSRTLVSGKKISVGKDGERIETIFKNVKFNAADGCYASSGSIEGSVFAKDAQEASATYVVSFSGAAKTVKFTYADGTTKEVEYVADGCALEAQEAEEKATDVVEASSAAAVE